MSKGSSSTQELFAQQLGCPVNVGAAVTPTVGAVDGGLDTGGCSVVVVAAITTVPVIT
jgi:hypothetical protein